MKEQWNGFKTGVWTKKIDVRDFIQKNYTVYKGDESFLEGISEKNQKVLNKLKPKLRKELTEEEIAKKTEQARLRKLHAKKLIEEEKREAVERILNEDGRKLRERQKKQNEELKKNEEKSRFLLQNLLEYSIISLYKEEKTGGNFYVGKRTESGSSGKRSCDGNNQRKNLCVLHCQSVSECQRQADKSACQHREI